MEYGGRVFRPNASQRRRSRQGPYEVILQVQVHYPARRSSCHSHSNSLQKSGKLRGMQLDLSRSIAEVRAAGFRKWNNTNTAALSIPHVLSRLTSDKTAKGQVGREVCDTLNKLNKGVAHSASESLIYCGRRSTEDPQRGNAPQSALHQAPQAAA